MIYKGTYFDGRTSYAHVIEIEQATDELIITLKETGSSFRWSLSNIKSIEKAGGKTIIRYGNTFPYAYAEIESEAPYPILLKQLRGNKNIGINLYQLSWKVYTTMVMAILAIVVGYYFILLPILVDQIAKQIPMKTEIEMGNALRDQLKAEGQIDSVKSEYAHLAFQALHNPSRYEAIEIYILKDEKTLNAFASPGGRIFIYQGLIDKMKSSSELAGLIGHELAHVEKQHGLKSIIRSSMNQLLVALFFGDASGTISSIGYQAERFHYSRSLEEEADSYSLSFLEKNQIRLDGLADLLRVLKQHTPEHTNSWFTLFSSHPPIDQRIQKAVRYIEAHPTESRDNEALINAFNLLKR